jgi:PAS domain S-box-containing protein
MNKDLSTNEQRLRAIIDAAPECLMILAEDGSIQDINPAGLTILGANSLDQITGVSLYTFVVPEYHASVQLHLDEVLGDSSNTLEYELISLNETRHWVEMRSVRLGKFHNTPRAILSICRDVTQRKKIEAQLLHAQKIEAISTLTGGIAHDFNNILTAIIGYSNILKAKLKSDDPMRSYVDQILASSERAAGLTQSLLTFSRKTAISLQSIQLNETVQRAEKLIRQIIRENIELRTNLINADTTVLADSGQIEQILMNLAANARDAMPDGGSLSLSTEIKEINNEFIRTYGYGNPGTYVVMNVVDTGAGMDEKTQDRIFEPFFTTKEIGKGTGLGLSIVYGIVKQYQGFINCSSEAGKGTAISIYLPLANPTAQKSEFKASVIPQGGTETILIAEDDQEIRKLAVTFLENFGYTIVESENGEEAIQLFQQHEDKICLLLFDVIMPKINGKEAYEAIRRIKPGIKILFMSGFSTSTNIIKDIVGEGLDFLLKPISPEILLKKVREVLDK